MSVQEHISNLENQTKLIFYTNKIIESGDFLKPGLIGKKDSSIKDEICKVIKDYLSKYLEGVINKTSFDDNILSNEDILIVKQLVDVVKNKNVDKIKTVLSPGKATPKFIQPQHKNSGDSRAVFTSKEEQIPYNDSAHAIGKIASLLDITCITSRYGSGLPDIYDGLKIKILKENSVGYEASVIGRPSIIFDVPKECVEF